MSLRFILFIFILHLHQRHNRKVKNLNPSRFELTPLHLECAFLFSRGGEYFLASLKCKTTQLPKKNHKTNAPIIVPDLYSKSFKGRKSERWHIV